MKYRIIAILLAIAASAQGQELLDTDPSTIPAKGQRYRFRADFNHDGVMDVAISGDRSQFGNMGGSFEIYLGTRSGKWRYLDSIDAHPLAVNLGKRRLGEGILSVYLHSSASSGDLVHYSISKRGVKDISAKEIHPGDGGTDEGRKAYAKYFSDAVRLQPELSAIIDAKVTWSRYDR